MPQISRKFWKIKNFLMILLIIPIASASLDCPYTSEFKDGFYCEYYDGYDNCTDYSGIPNHFIEFKSVEGDYILRLNKNKQESAWIKLNEIKYDPKKNDAGGIWNVSLKSGNNLSIHSVGADMNVTICKEVDSFYKIINIPADISAVDEEQNMSLALPLYKEKRNAKITKNGKIIAKVKVDLSENNANWENVTINSGDREGYGFASIHVDENSKVEVNKELYIPIIAGTNKLCLISDETNESLIDNECSLGEVINDPIIFLGFYVINVTGSVAGEIDSGSPFIGGFSGGGSRNIAPSQGAIISQTEEVEEGDSQNLSLLILLIIICYLSKKSKKENVIDAFK